MWIRGGELLQPLRILLSISQERSYARAMAGQGRGGGGVAITDQASGRANGVPLREHRTHRADHVRQHRGASDDQLHSGVSVSGV